MKKVVCPFCGREYAQNKYCLQSHIENNCKKNPSNNYTEEPQFFEKGKKYLKEQKIKYTCNSCGKTRTCFFENFKESYIEKCAYCEKTESSNKTKIEKYGSVENYNKIHRQNFEKRLAEKYGSLENGYRYIQKQKEHAVQKKYGVSNVSKLDFVNDKRKKTMSKEETKQKTRDSLRRTCEAKYGVSSYFETKTFKEKAIATWTKKYGSQDLVIDNPFEVPSIIKKIRDKAKQTIIQKYGVENYSQSIEAQKHHRARYEYENVFFDSSAELAFWIWCKDTGKTIERSPLKIPYIFNGKTHYYFPDFKVDEKLFEIKGPQFLKDDGTWQNIFDHSKDELLEAKHQCAIENEVTILYDNDYKKYLDYVEQKYSKDFLKLFQVDIKFPYLNTDLKVKVDDGLIQYFHKSIYDAHRKNYKSPKSAWNDKSLVLKSALNRLKEVGSCKPKDVLRGFSVAKIAPKVSVFKASLAKKLIAQYLSSCTTIVDPFSGFSGRMLGAAANGKKYIGKDLNKKHVEESNKIIAYKGLKDCSVIVEDILKKTNVETYDALFTCPPYEDKENWNGENDICKTCDEWVGICMEKYDCKKYLFVVDSTSKFTKNIVQTLENASHFGKNYEYVLLIEK